jgi:hypothetical protein
MTFLMGMFCIGTLILQPLYVMGGDTSLPNHPPLLKAQEERIAFVGIPPGEDPIRVWKKRTFFNDQQVLTSAFCLENLTVQRVFPAGGPAFGEGVLCIEEPKMVGANEYTTTSFSSSCLPVLNDKGSRAPIVESLFLSRVNPIRMEPRPRPFHENT